jgi:GxxExxY protein
VGQRLSDFRLPGVKHQGPAAVVQLMDFTDRTYAIIGAAMQVHRELGPCLSEVTYQRALAVELEELAIAHEREVPVPVWYRGRKLGVFRADFACGEVLLEIKALPYLGHQPLVQLAHYLAATGKPVGLVLNFGAPSLQFKRVFPRRSNISGPAAGAIR